MSRALHLNVVSSKKSGTDGTVTKKKKKKRNTNGQWQNLETDETGQKI